MNTVEPPAAGDHYFWFGRVPLDVRVDSLVPHGRTLVLGAVGMDEHAIRLVYEIEPPVERERLWPDMCLWLLTGRDSNRAEYADHGGALGTAPGGAITEGVRSLSRVLTVGATWIELTIRTMDAPAGAPPAWVGRIEIPPS